MPIKGVDMNIKLTRAPESFYLLAPSDDTKVPIKILDATLFVTEVELKHPSSSCSRQCLRNETQSTLSCDTLSD